MRRHIRHIVIGITILLFGYFAFKYLNSNGQIIPFKISDSRVHPKIKDYMIMDFKTFTITLPQGWKDKGFIVGEEGEIRGELKKDKYLFVYEYGITATSPTKELLEYLFQARNNDIIMGDEVIVGKTDSTISVKYVYPVSSETSDTIRTGLLTDSILKLYPKIKIPKVLLGEPNYYSLTKYNDSVYFIPIEVPDEIADSRIINFDSLGYCYNVVRPINRETGCTKVNVYADGFLPFSLWGEGLNSSNQEILIEAGLSVRFNNKYRQGESQLFFEKGE